MQTSNDQFRNYVKLVEQAWRDLEERNELSIPTCEALQAYGINSAELIRKATNATSTKETDKDR